MFQKYYLILFISLLNNVAFSQNFWERIQSPTNNFLRTLHFADSLRGWVGGDSGSIFYTSDGGLNWDQQQTNTTSKIMRLFFLDDYRAWALAWADAGVGDNAFYGTEILTTTNGGQNWNVEQYREENVFLRGIYFLDTLKGFAGGVPGTFLQTFDGGITWEPANIDSGTFSHFPVIDFKFYDQEYGFACGGRFDIAGVIWRTINGGESWAPLDVLYSPADEVWDIHFFDSLNVMGIGGDPDQYGVGMLTSTDAGISWDYFEIGVFGQTLAVSFRTENEGWAVVPQSETFVATFDYGNTWIEFQTPYCSKMYDISFPDSSIGYAVGEEGVILKYAYRRPLISNVKRNIAEVGIGVPVPVTAEVTDLDGIVTGVNLFYRLNYYGEYIELPMTLQSQNTWQTTIPAQNDSTLIDYFINASDNNSYVSLSPKDTAFNNYFYLVLGRPLTIQDVQFSPFGSGYSFNCEFEGGSSGYDGYEVTVRGIVTADTTDIEGNETGILSGSQVYIQNGIGPWSGIKITGDAVLQLRTGDDVSVTGFVNENFDLTEISGIHNPSQINIHSTGNSVPKPELLLTATIDQVTSGAVQAEQWEGVLIKFDNIIVKIENADGYPGPHSPPNNNNFGDLLVSDKDTIPSYTRISLQYGTHSFHNFWREDQDSLFYITLNDTILSITGVLSFASNNYKLIPRKNDDFDGISEIRQEEGLLTNYGLLQNYPNPFNPSTRIEYNLPVAGNVTLKIFNILGQKVRTLLNNEYKISGKHIVEFNADGLPSGIYLYRIQVNDYFKVMKMILLK